MAWFVADTASSESSRSDLRAKGAFFHPLAVQSDALTFVTEVNTCSVTKNACLQRDTATRAGVAGAEPLAAQLEAVCLSGFWKTHRSTVEAA